MDYVLSLLIDLFVYWETVWKICALALIIGGAIRFIRCTRGGSRSVRSPGVFLCCLGSVMFFWVWNATSPQSKAAGIVTLPQEAQVLRVEEGDWAGDGKVTFKLPTNHSPKFWLDQIWKVNGTKQGLVLGEGVHLQSGEKEISYLGNEYNIDLKYDEVAQTYSYVAELPK